MGMSTTTMLVDFTMPQGKGEPEAQFFMRSASNKNYRKIVEDFEKLRPAEKEEKLHSNHVAQIEALMLMPPKDVMFFDPSRQSFSDFLLTVTDEELEETRKHNLEFGYQASDEAVKEGVMNNKVALAVRIINKYFERISDPNA